MSVTAVKWVVAGRKRMMLRFIRMFVATNERAGIILRRSSIDYFEIRRMGLVDMDLPIVSCSLLTTQLFKEYF